jgi:hypothetical protein
VNTRLHCIQFCDALSGSHTLAGVGTPVLSVNNDDADDELLKGGFDSDRGDIGEDSDRWCILGVNPKVFGKNDCVGNDLRFVRCISMNDKSCC